MLHKRLSRFRFGCPISTIEIQDLLHIKGRKEAQEHMHMQMQHIWNSRDCSSFCSSVLCDDVKTTLKELNARSAARLTQSSSQLYLWRSLLWPVGASDGVFRKTAEWRAFLAYAPGVERRGMRSEMGTLRRQVTVWQALVLMGFLAVCYFVKADGASEVNCEALGFTGLALCSDCDSLAEYVKDQELESDCRKCCAQESEDSLNKVIYAGAILEVCSRKLIYYPNVQSVVDGKLSKIPNVEVQYRYGSPPKLIMKDKLGNQKEIIRIDNWKSENIEQFLKEKVKP